MNRETRRQLKSQGTDETGAPLDPAERRRRPAPAPPHKERTSPKQFVDEVQGELKKVAWPDRHELISSSIVVLVASVVVVAAIFGMDYAFGKLVFYLFG